MSSDRLGPSGRESALLEQADRAVRETVSHAVRAPFYRERFGQRWRRVQGLADLHLLPILDKPTAVAHQRRLLVGRAPLGFGVASSGTTRATGEPPLHILHSDEEYAAWAETPWDDGAPRGAVEAPDPHPGWTLVAVGVHHGLPGEAPPGELHVPWTLHRNALHMLHAMLSRPQPDGRPVTAMRISAGALKTFLAWLLEQRLDTSGYRVRAIGTNGSRLTPLWRAQVARQLGATVVDNFSLSEFRTPASECEACGRLHFGWPPVAWELVHPTTGRPVSGSATPTGRLLLTGLYPFVQKMPLIRYDTGDAVRLFPARCRLTGKQGFEYLGRVRRGVVGPGGAFLLAPAHVQDALEALPDTERNEHIAVTMGFVRTREIGLPRWTVSLAPRRGRPPLARLDFEVRFTPSLFPRRAEDLQAHLRRALLSQEPELRRLLRTRGVELEVCARPPRSITPPADKFE